MKSVIIAFSNPLLSTWITTDLNRGGYTVEYSCKTVNEVARVADYCSSLVVVSGFQFAEMTALDLRDLLDGRLELITIVLPHQRDLVVRQDMKILTYPVNPIEVISAVEEAERSAAMRAVIPAFRGDEKKRSTERTTEDKLLILKSKEKLMDEMQMTESQAHRFLQKYSMDRGLKLIDAARMVLENSLTL
jgi:two-component system, response regulator PdtaR